MRNGTCSDIAGWIDPYIDDQLSAEAEARVEAHAQQCVDCRRRVALRKAVAARVRSAAGLTPLSEGLRSEIAATRRFSLLAQLSGRYRWWVAAAATLVLALLVAGGPDGGWFWRTAELRSMEGKLVCMGKRLEEKYSLRRDCESYGHQPVVETSDGQLWHLVNNRSARELELVMSDDDRPTVRLLGYVYPEERFLEIESYQLAGAARDR